MVQTTTRDAQDGMLKVFTAHISSKDEDRLDITRKSGKEGIFLAPSWSILSPYLSKRWNLSQTVNELFAHIEDLVAEGLVAEGDDDSCGALQTINYEIDIKEQELEKAWSKYAKLFVDEMRTSYRENKDLWLSLLKKDRVVLCCYCNDHTMCHRTIVAKEILPKLGAKYCGEL